MRIELQDMKSDYDGFNQLIDLSSKTTDCVFEDIDIDMTNVKWFDANISAPFGAILYSVSRGLNTVNLINILRTVEEILSKNGFLTNYGRQLRVDKFGTTIEYKRFEPIDGRYFGAYVDKHLIGKGIPKMSQGFLKKFRESIFEIFSNAVIHSGTKLGIFSCGQFFPRMNRLDFTIADLGIGIHKNILKKLGLTMAPDQAINWAMSGNTTKMGKIPGGSGLKILRDFITLNKGRIQIVSDKGYWELSNGNVITNTFPESFPGTVVTIEFNTADKKSYCLASEIKPEDIF